MKTVWYWCKDRKNRPKEPNRELSTYMWSINFHKEYQSNLMSKGKSFSVNDTRRTG